MRLNDLTLGFVVLLGAIAIFLSAQQFSPIPGQDYGAATMPTAISLLAFGVGLVMVGKSIAAGERRPGLALAAWTRSPASLLGFLATIALILSYILFSDFVGFLPIAFGVTFGLMLVLGVGPITAVVVSLVAAVVIQQAFGTLLLVPLPRSDFLASIW